MLKLCIPTPDELWLRKMMLEDAATMSYNHAYGGHYRLSGKQMGRVVRKMGILQRRQQILWLLKGRRYLRRRSCIPSGGWQVACRYPHICSPKRQRVRKRSPFPAHRKSRGERHRRTVRQYSGGQRRGYILVQLLRFRNGEERQRNGVGAQKDFLQI